MRLIDANEAIRKVEQIPFIVNENKAFHEGCRYMQKKVLRVLHESKAIEAEPVKHGKWILKDQNGNGVCSNCNRQDNIDPLATNCRYCGAKMDLEV